MESINPDEMEAFQRLSDQYQPEIQVGLTPSGYLITDHLRVP